MEELEKTPCEAPAAEHSAEAPKKPWVSIPSKHKIFSDVLEILETMAISIFVVFLVFTYLVRPVTVDGRSMYPTLGDRDKLVMFRLCYHPQVGDIVVIDNTQGHVLDADGNVVESTYSLVEPIIKRVIAEGGQTVEVDAGTGTVYVDGVALNEPYLNELTLTDDGAFNYPITIPEGYLFVMGDNRNHSTDSRSSAVGLVPREAVLGLAYFRYEPTSNIGFVS